VRNKLFCLVAMALSWLSLSVSGLCAPAASKYTMPDLRQVDSTCFPNAAANLIYWFGQNGYPQLLPKEPDEKARQDKLVTRLIIQCRTTFLQGTPFQSLVDGISNYMSSCGCDAQLTYRGFNSKELNEDWFKENEHDNKGFILCIGYCQLKGDKDLVEERNTGHAVTLLQYTDHVAVLNDSAHAKGQSGRRVVRLASSGPIRYHSGNHHVYNCEVIYLEGMPDLPKDVVATLIGAICVEMLPKRAADEKIAEHPAIEQSWWQRFWSR
jgi:hypothetical protein